MFILYFKHNGKLTEVSHTRNLKADLETQGEIEVDDEANAGVTVNTPTGTMALLDALMSRTGAFTVEAGELVHETEWQAEL